MAATARGRHSRKAPNMSNNGFSEKPRNNQNVTTFPVETAAATARGGTPSKKPSISSEKPRNNLNVPKFPFGPLDECRGTTHSMMAPNRFSEKPRNFQNIPTFPFGTSGANRKHSQPHQNHARSPHNQSRPPHNHAWSPLNQAEQSDNRAQPPQNCVQLPQNHSRPPLNRSPPNENSDLLEVLKAIQLELRCCGCRSPLRSARLCLNGHGVCPDCKRRGDNLCPQCKVPTMNENLAIVENIIKLLPKVCEFARFGCEMVILPNDYDHEKFCRFRYTRCEMRECTWMGQAKDLMVHLEEKHNKELVRTAKKTQILIDFDCTVDKMSAVPILAFNNVFWQHTVVKNKQLLQFYRYVPMGKLTKVFSVFVSFHTPEKQRSYFTPVHSDVIKLEVLEKHGRTFCLTKEETAAFHRFYSGVQYTFEVTESKI